MDKHLHRLFELRDMMDLMCCIPVDSVFAGSERMELEETPAPSIIRVLRYVRSIFQHLHHLRPGTGGIGGELPAAGTIGDFLLISPQHCIVVGSGAHIRKGGVPVTSGEPLARHKKVAICARVQGASGENFPLPVPPVMPRPVAHRTAS